MSPEMREKLLELRAGLAAVLESMTALLAKMKEEEEQHKNGKAPNRAGHE